MKYKRLKIWLKMAARLLPGLPGTEGEEQLNLVCENIIKESKENIYDEETDTSTTQEKA